MAKPIISLIAALDRNGLIGNDNSEDGLPWDIPEDLKFFREVTRGKPVIMGRKTHEMIGRLLPKRPNIIISRQDSLVVEGAETATTLDQALSLAATHSSEEIMIIGGAQIYKLALEQQCLDRMYLTHIDGEFEGNVYFPQFNKSNWNINVFRQLTETKTTPACDFTQYDFKLTNP